VQSAVDHGSTFTLTLPLMDRGFPLGSGHL
jgi:hypothetical protein